MNRIVVIAVCASAMLACSEPAPEAGHESAETHAAAAGAAHWSYAGETGPTAWAALDTAFAACGIGTRQSPVDLAVAASDTSQPELRVEYTPADASVTNNGHTLHADVPAGGVLHWGDETYRLVQLHHHRPGEHTIDGQPAAVEVHLVHRHADRRLAVLGVLIDEGEDRHPVLDALLRAGAPDGESVKLTLDASELIPSDLSYSSYEGSLTTPPCTEGVRWIVLHARGSATVDQVARLDGVLPPNARPAMPVSGRTIVRRGRPLSR